MKCKYSKNQRQCKTKAVFWVFLSNHQNENTPNWVKPGINGSSYNSSLPRMPSPSRWRGVPVVGGRRSAVHRHGRTPFGWLPPDFGNWLKKTCTSKTNHWLSVGYKDFLGWFGWRKEKFCYLWTLFVRKENRSGTISVVVDKRHGFKEVKNLGVVTTDEKAEFLCMRASEWIRSYGEQYFLQSLWSACGSWCQGDCHFKG